MNTKTSMSMCVRMNLLLGHCDVSAHVNMHVPPLRGHTQGDPATATGEEPEGSEHGLSLCPLARALVASQSTPTGGGGPTRDAYYYAPSRFPGGPHLMDGEKMKRS